MFCHGERRDDCTLVLPVSDLERMTKINVFLPQIDLAVHRRRLVELAPSQTPEVELFITRLSVPVGVRCKVILRFRKGTLVNGRGHI